MNKDKKFKNVPLCIEKSSFEMKFYVSPEGLTRMDALNKKVSGKLFHASPEGVKRMDALNKLANNRLVLLFRRLAKGKSLNIKSEVAVYWTSFPALIGTF